MSRDVKDLSNSVLSAMGVASDIGTKASPDEDRGITSSVASLVAEDRSSVGLNRKVEGKDGVDSNKLSAILKSLAEAQISLIGLSKSDLKDSDISSVLRDELSTFLKTWLDKHTDLIKAELHAFLRSWVDKHVFQVIQDIC